MVPLSELAMCMSMFDRRNQLLCWYTDGIYLCTENSAIAAQIEAECKRRDLDYNSVLAREMFRGPRHTPFEDAMIPYSIHKIYIYWSLEENDVKQQKLRARGITPAMEIWKLHAACCVPALKKKQLADWAITTFNRYAIAEGQNKNHYDVWIQPSSEVPIIILKTEEEDENDVETHWVTRH